jgi:uncharacterized protein YbaR (Trm112 family)
MHRSLLDILACPSCRVGYELTAHEESGDDIALGFLRCPRCAIVIPVLDGLVLFTEALLHAGLATAPALADMAQRLFGSAAAFDEYRRDKLRRGVLESYAAFAPFNESTRVIEPILPHAIGSLRRADRILDTWCRTGWSGEWLAGRFPAQRVVSIWEGNSSVLGYRGFRHLLGTGQRARNLDIVFCDLEKPLPFRDAAFGMVYAYDSLHRYSLYPFAGECLRVARGDAAVVFPHLHLSNSEPEPFFERGCHQHHGRDYRAWLDRDTAAGRRRGWVLSEAAVFNGPAVAELVDEPDTSHYNGMVAILPDAPVSPTPMACERGARRFVVSPLFRISLARASAHVAPGLFDGAVGRLLQRHPVYQARLPDGSVGLSEHALLALLLAAVGMREDAIEATVLPDSGQLPPALQAMTDRELLRPAAVSVAGHRLQRFHANQLPLRDGGILEGFWSRIAAAEQELLILVDGDGYSGIDLAQFAGSVAALLRERGLASGDWIAVSVGAHPLLLLAAIAAASSGFHVSLCPARADLLHVHVHQDTKLLLHGDAETVPVGVVALPLGLAGDATSLLSLLEAQVAGDVGLQPADTGLLEFDLPTGRAQCRLADLVEGFESLSAQVEHQLWLLEGRSQFGDLCACLAGWCRAENVRVLASGNAA